jgi:hypothetical protein
MLLPKDKGNKWNELSEMTMHDYTTVLNVLENVMCQIGRSVISQLNFYVREKLIRL